MSRLAYTTSRAIRMASTMGASGRIYIPSQVLQRKHNMNSIVKAECENQSFVLKHVNEWFFDLSQRLATEFPDSRRLRMHVDYTQDKSILVYPYFRSTLLALVQEVPDFPPAERKKILRDVGEAIQELHQKNWIHIDVKPDNILVDWTRHDDGKSTITNVALGDFDIAFKLEPGASRQTPYAIGNVMWRSPEGQTGSGVTKASDIFSFGLVCIYAFGGRDYLVLEDFQALEKEEISPEQEILTRHFSYFGPVTEGLLKQVNSENWRRALTGASTIADELVKETPELRFENWGKVLGPEAQDMISRMTNLNPTARPTIDQVLAHSWWQED